MAAPASGTGSKESTGGDPKTPKSSKSSSDFYGYLFDEKKSPTPILDSLLRAIAKHIVAEIGDKSNENLTPPKLAAFYKAVGGDYDSLFVGVPYESISFIWQFTGCQYSLQPVDGRDYEAPSIPALTPRGFVRWESIEILLGPEEHVPFIQHAVKHWALKHPETGEPFPTDLPKEAFPSAADPEIDKWHKSCAEKLRQRATPTFEQAAFRSSAGDSSRPQSAERAEPKARMPYAHVRNPNAEPPLKGGRREPDYFARPVRVVHGQGRVPSQRSQIPPTERQQKFRPGSSSDERTRRRSLSDYPSPPPEGGHFNHLHAERPAGPPRRHSQPRHHSSSSSVDDSDDASPRTRHRPGSGTEDGPRRRATVRIVPAGNHPTPPGSSQSHSHSREDPRKRSLPFTVPEVIRGGFDKVTSFVSSRSPERHRSSSGRRSDREREREREREAARRREHMVASKLRGSWEDLDADESDASDSSVQRRTRMKLRRAEKDAREEELRIRERERERERERDRGRDRGRAKQDRERDWEREKEREREEELELRKRRDRERFLQRPEAHRRTSSHADIDRMREDIWDPRERDFRDDKRRWKERERATSPMTGVTGRRYPPEPVWN